MNALMTEEMISWIVACLIVMAFSPIGVYLLRLLVYVAMGGERPSPPRRRRKDDVVDVVEGLADQHALLRAHTDELEARIGELVAERDFLFAENNALKDALRRRDNEEGEQGNTPPPKSDDDVRNALRELDLPENVIPDTKTIRDAWRDAVKKHHPDVAGPDIDQGKIERVNAAFETLKKICEKKT